MHLCFSAVMITKYCYVGFLSFHSVVYYDHSQSYAGQTLVKRSWPDYIFLRFDNIITKFGYSIQLKLLCHQFVLIVILSLLCMYTLYINIIYILKVWLYVVMFSQRYKSLMSIVVFLIWKNILSSLQTIAPIPICHTPKPRWRNRRRVERSKSITTHCI